MDLTPSKAPHSSEMNYKDLLVWINREDLLEKSKTTLVGYKDTIDEIKDLIRDRQNFMVTGPSGVGKTTVIRKLAEQSKLNYVYIASSWLLSKEFSRPNVHAEAQLGRLFTEAITRAPSLVFIDDLDDICDRKRSQSDIKDRMYNKIRDQLARLESVSKDVFVVTATNKPELIDTKVLRYFDEEVRFSLPSFEDRLAFISQAKLSAKFLSDDRKDIANHTRFYLYEDLRKLLRIAKKKSPVNTNYETVKSVLSLYKPKTVRDYTTPCPPQRWEDIGGVADVKKMLENSVIAPLKDQDKYQRVKLTMDRGALLYGPPGCSKTMLARALANESGFNFISVKGPELISKYVGDTEAAIRRLYRNAREIAPCIIFFDEIDGFAAERSDSHDSSVGVRLVTQLLTEFDGPPDNVFTLAATNRPHKVDSALLRPGRLKKAIYIPLPSKKDRVEIFRVHMRGRPFKFELPIDEIVEQFADRTEGYSGADIMGVVDTAARNFCHDKEADDHIEMKHFEDAFVRSLTTNENLASYRTFYEMTTPKSERLTDITLRALQNSFNDSLNLD